MSKQQLSGTIRDLCRTNFLVFQKVELGMEVAMHHKQWWEMLKTGEDCEFLSPRDHGKSVSMARAYPIWKAKYDKRIKEIYLLGPDRDSAVENLDKLKNFMLDKPSLRYLVPATRSQGINSRSELHLMNRVIIRAKGVLSPLRGRHPQLIICDDILNEKNSLGTEARDRLYKYFFEVIIPMKDRGTERARKEGYKPQIVIIGTVQHKEDLYSKLLENPSFKSVRQRAILDEEKRIVLWPQRYDYQSLAELRTKLGSLVFSKEYQNEPISDDTSLFPPSLFEPLKDKELSYQKVYTGNNPVYLGADFSIPGSTDGDWTVYFVIEVDRLTGMITPLNYWRERPNSMAEQVAQLEYMCEAYQVTLGDLEDNMFQRVYAQHMRKNTNLPLRGKTVSHTGKNSAETGVLAFRPLLENQKIRLPYKTEADRKKTDHMITEFSGTVQRKGRIGNEGFHDDVVIGFWHALTASKDSTQFSYEMI